MNNTIDAIPPFGAATGSASFPPVLDACCSTRMFWFDKQDDRALYVDKRQGTRIIDVGTPGTIGCTPKTVAPDMVADFRNLPFPDGSFWHVVLDPPHFHKGAGATGRIAFDFGLLDATWRDDLRQGFAECFRVLKPGGTLIFKWSEVEIPLREVLALTPERPLYGHRSGKKAQTHWVAFLKPNELVVEAISRRSLCKRPFGSGAVPILREDLEEAIKWIDILLTTRDEKIYVNKSILALLTRLRAAKEGKS